MDDTRPRPQRPLTTTSPTTTRGALLLEAMHIIDNDRNRTYGEPYETMKATGDLWGQMTQRPPVPASEVALFLTAVKLARLHTSPTHRDSYLDAAAYIAIAYECAAREADGRGEK